MKPYIVGLKSYLQIVKRNLFASTGGTDSPRYCYTVWLRHLLSIKQFSDFRIPEVVAEFGPGDSLGLGLTALLSGANKYFALDIHEYANLESNQKMLDDLVNLFEQNIPIPDDSEFPIVRPPLTDYQFPESILNSTNMSFNLSTARIEKIRNDLEFCNNSESSIQYIVPWQRSDKLKDNSVDMIFSQSVMQYIDDLELAFQDMHSWLKVGGAISHVIDFSGHCHFKEWNEHWRYSKFAWKIIKGKRPYFINRAPLSTYLDVIEKTGFRIINVVKENKPSAIMRRQLAHPFKNLSDEDLCTANALIQAVKVG